MLTRRGWALAGAAVAFALAGALVGVEELLAVAVGATALLAASGLWVGLRPWRVVADRRLPAPRVGAGAVARVELAIGNRHRRTSPVLRARDGFDGGRRVALFSVAPLAPGELRRATYRLATAGRGLFTLGPLELALVDPFGLVRVVRRAAGSSQLVVHPVVEPLVTLPPPGLSDEAGAGIAGLVGHRSEEFFALREYQTGDDLRRVHWASSARTEELMIRSDQATWRGRLTIVVDVRAGVHDRASFEAVLSAAASVVDAAFRAGNPVRLLTTGGADSGEGVSAAHRGLALDLLAAARPADRDGPGLVGRLGPAARTVRDTSVVVISSASVSDRDLMGLRPFTTAGCQLTVVLRGGRRTPTAPAGLGSPPWGGGRGWGPGRVDDTPGGSGGGSVGRVAPGPVIAVPAGAAFAPAWERAMLAIRAERAGVI